MPLEAKIFRNGANQAVRIPVELSFDTDTVIIERVADGVMLRPKRSGGWRDFFANGDLVLPDEFEAPEDLLIAAHARSVNAAVVTNNTREFNRVPGLSVENWF